MGGPVCGIDEVGRGPWAGPVVACAVVLWQPVDGLADSKTLSRPVREARATALLAPGVAAWGWGVASVAEIDRLNIRVATFLAMARALARLPARPGRVLVDGREAPDLGVRVEAIVGGDATEPAIAAASIIAKTRRDGLMAKLAMRYPDYGWATNQGYGTAAHRAGLERVGPSPHHRRSFAPVRAVQDRAAALRA